MNILILHKCVRDKWIFESC